MAEYTIKTIKKTKVTTKYGEKDKYLITLEEKEGYFDSWVGFWNKNWAEGMRIKAEDSQFKSREYNGQTYYTIAAPPEARQNFGQNNERLDLIEERLSSLEKWQDSFTATPSQESNIPEYDGQ